jgi:hypothetical protein
LYQDPNGLEQLFRQLMRLFQMHAVKREEPGLALTGQDDVASLTFPDGDFDSILALIGETLDMPPEFVLSLTSPEQFSVRGHQQMQKFVQLFFQRQVFRFVKDTAMGHDQLFFEINFGALQELFVDLNKRKQDTDRIGWAQEVSEVLVLEKVQLACVRHP